MQYVHVLVLWAYLICTYVCTYLEQMAVLLVSLLSMLTCNTPSLLRDCEGRLVN